MNYIVSGLERSGTSLVMQILKEGGFPIAFDSSRKADRNNPKGYYELEGGKIIKAIEEGSFEFNKYTGKAIKVTAYGIKHLPRGEYTIIYIERNINEIILSTDHMSESNLDREELRVSLQKLNDNTKTLMNNSPDMKVLYIQHRNLFINPEEEIDKISKFLGGLDVERALKVIDPKLYRNRVFKADKKFKRGELSDKESILIRERLWELGYI